MVRITWFGKASEIWLFLSRVEQFRRGVLSKLGQTIPGCDEGTGHGADALILRCLRFCEILPLENKTVIGATRIEGEIARAWRPY